MFVRDPRTETLLKRMGVKWRYTNSVPFDKLAKGWQTGR